MSFYKAIDSVKIVQDINKRKKVINMEGEHGSVPVALKSHVISILPRGQYRMKKLNETYL